MLELGIFLVLVGAYYAATDGVLMALASSTVPAHLRGSGLALLVTATSLAKLVASIAFGALWTAFDAETAVIAFAVGLGRHTLPGSDRAGRQSEEALECLTPISNR